MVNGGCLCGGVRFEIAGKLSPIQFCHARRCRKAGGSAFAAEMGTSREGFRWTRGEHLVTRYQAPLLKEPPAYERAFCSLCGSPLPVLPEGLPYVVLQAGSLDEESQLTPFRHAFVDQQAPWLEILDDLPQFEGRPPGPDEGDL